MKSFARRSFALVLLGLLSLSSAWRVNYVETSANSVDLAAIPSTPPPVASAPPVPHG